MEYISTFLLLCHDNTQIKIDLIKSIKILYFGGAETNTGFVKTYGCGRQKQE